MNLDLNIFNQILIIGVIQGFIFCIITFYNNRVKDKAIFFLNMTVLFLTINNFQAWLTEKDIMFSFYYLKYLKAPWNIFLAPMFYMFLIHYLRIEEKVKHFFRISLILFIIFLITRIYLLDYLKPHFASSHFESVMRRYNSYEDILIFVYTISIFIYTAFIFFKRKKRFEMIFLFDNLRWIKIFFILSTMVLSFWLIALFLNFIFISVNTSYFYSPLRLGTSFLIYWIGYQGLYQQKIVKNRMVLRDDLSKQILKDDKLSYFKSNAKKSLGFDRKLGHFNQINEFIISKKKFIDPNINLKSLSTELRMSTSTLSQLINNYSKSNFTDYINKYRVELAKELIIDDDYKNYTILSIGLESGFNSKSTFYTAFKKFTNLTPLEYKKQFSENKFVRNLPD